MNGEEGELTGCGTDGAAVFTARFVEAFWGCDVLAFAVAGAFAFGKAFFVFGAFAAAEGTGTDSASESNGDDGAAAAAGLFDDLFFICFSAIAAKDRNL